MTTETTRRRRRAHDRESARICKRIAERLRLVRLVLGISEEEAAAAYGVRVATYRRYEEGARQTVARRKFASSATRTTSASIG
jgi:predicted DNA-binding protein (UPF0251 family)